MVKIKIRPVTADDSKFIADLFNNSDHIKYMSTYVRCVRHTEEDVRKSIEESDPDYERLFMITDGTRTVGHAGIDEINLNDKRGEIFFVISKKETGKGYGTKSVKLLLDYAFGELGLNSVFATATVTNHPSITILEKTGFKRIGTRRAFNLIDGKFLDEIFFDKLSSD